MKYKYGKWIKLHNPTTSCEHKKNRYNKEWWVGITVYHKNNYNVYVQWCSVCGSFRYKYKPMQRIKSKIHCTDIGEIDD